MRPLLVTSDAALLDDVLAVASDAGTDVDVVPDVAGAAHRWTTAPLVLLDAAQASDAATLPPRPGLVVVARQLDESQAWRELMALRVEHVVELVTGAVWLRQRLAGGLQESSAELLAVIGACGGAGASTLAAALARRAAVHGPPSTLVDLDPTGGGLDLLVGAEDVAGVRWDELAGVTGRVEPAALREALPQVEDVALLSWPAEASTEPDAAAVGHVVDSLARTAGTVVLDVGRAVDVRAEAALAGCRRPVLLVPLRVRAVTAARRRLQLLPAHAEPVVVVREPAPGGVARGDVEHALGCEVAAVLTVDRRRPEREEMGGGLPSGALWDAVCDVVLAPRAVAR